MRIGLQQFERFITDRLPDHLKKDLLKVRMVKEADLECCAYYHINRYLRRDDDWRILARKHSRHTGHFIDLLIFRKAVPRVAVELKWHRAEISKKDRQSLRRGIKRLRVNRAYFITTLIGAKKYSRIKKATVEKNRLFEIIIPLTLSVAELKEWKERRRRYTSRMSRRRKKRGKRPAG